MALEPSSAAFPNSSGRNAKPASDQRQEAPPLDQHPPATPGAWTLPDEDAGLVGVAVSGSEGVRRHPHGGSGDLAVNPFAIRDQTKQIAILEGQAGGLDGGALLSEDGPGQWIPPLQSFARSFAPQTVETVFFAESVTTDATAGSCEFRGQCFRL